MQTTSNIQEIPVKKTSKAVQPVITLIAPPKTATTKYFETKRGQIVTLTQKRPMKTYKDVTDVVEKWVKM